MRKTFDKMHDTVVKLYGDMPKAAEIEEVLTQSAAKRRTATSRSSQRSLQDAADYSPVNNGDIFQGTATFGLRWKDIEAQYEALDKTKSLQKGILNI